MKSYPGKEHAGQRLDVYVSGAANITRSSAAKLIEEGGVLVNGKMCAKNYRAEEKDEIEITIPEASPAKAQAEALPLDIVYEDGDIIVINKKAGMVVHPAAGNENGTLVNALLYHCGSSLSGIGGQLRPGIVHRIDKETSGLIAVAKNDAAHQGLSAQLKTRQMGRVYYALATGSFKENAGRIEAPIGRHPADRKKMAVIKENQHARARSAATDWEVLERYGRFTLLRLCLETGRTHQIRVHLSYIGHPIVGDTVYGGGHTAFEKQHKSLLTGQLLHAKELHLQHPRTGESMNFECPLPENFSRVIEILSRMAE